MMLGFPRIHTVVNILIINDFIFNSKNLKIYYNKVKPLLEISSKGIDNINKHKEEYDSLSERIQHLASEEVKKYEVNYKRHSPFPFGGFFIMNLFSNKKALNPELNEKSNVIDFSSYFKYFVLQKVNDKPINKEIIYRYNNVIKKLREEYEKIKDVKLQNENVGLDRKR